MRQMQLEPLMPLSRTASVTSSTARQFLAALSNQDLNSLGRLLAEDAVLTAYTGLPEPLGGVFTGPEAIVSFYRARLALRLETKLIWSISLVDNEDFVLYGLAVYSNPRSGLQRYCTLSLWFKVQRGQLTRKFTHLDSAPLGMVIGTIPTQPEGRVLSTISDAARQTLSFGGELIGPPSEDFSHFIDAVQNNRPSSRQELLSLMAPDVAWLGPANQLAGHSVRLSGLDSIAAHLQEFDQLYEIASMKYEDSAQAEDTLALRLTLELRSRSSGEVLQLPAFAAFTMRAGRIVRVVEVYDSLRLLPGTSNN